MHFFRIVKFLQWHKKTNQLIMHIETNFSCAWYTRSPRCLYVQHVISKNNHNDKIKNHQINVKHTGKQISSLLIFGCFTFHGHCSTAKSSFLFAWFMTTWPLLLLLFNVKIFYFLLETYNRLSSKQERLAGAWKTKTKDFLSVYRKK